MAKMISRTNENFEIEGAVIEAVSFFDYKVRAYDVSTISNEMTDSLMDSSDDEEFAEENGIRKIELNELSSGQYGTDMYIPSEQSKTKAVVFDLDTVEMFEGGVKEYTECWDEMQRGIEHLDGGNILITWESDDLVIEE